MVAAMREKGFLGSSFILLLSLCACEGIQSYAPPVTKDNDKGLTCAQIEMEINEAETYRHQAVENRSFSLANLMSPFRYPATAMNADKAVTATEQRSAYLKQIYGIRRCGSQETKLQEARMAQPPYAQPQQAYLPPQAVMRGYAPAPYNQAPYQANTFNGQNAMQMAAPSSAPPANWPAPPPPIGAYPPAGVPVQPMSPPPVAQSPAPPMAQPVEQAAALPVQPGGNAPSVQLTPPDEAQPVGGEPIMRRQPGYMEF